MVQDVSRVIFKGGILGSTRHFLGDPYLTLLLYCLIITNLFMHAISAIFSNPVIGMLVGFLAWFINFFPYLFLANRYEQLST